MTLSHLSQHAVDLAPHASVPIFFAFTLITFPKRITDMVATATARVLSQYQPKPKFMALVAELAGRAQEVETAVYGIVTQLAVGAAEGVWLDYLGKIVGQARGGLADLEYSQTVNGRIIANGSNGTIENLLSAIDACYGLTGANGFTLIEWDFCAVTIKIPPTVAQPLESDLLLQATLKVMRGAKSAGIKLTLEYQPDVDAEIFTLDDSTSPGSVTGEGFGDSTAPLTDAGELAGASDT